MEFPKYTKTFHTETYPAISATRPELSTAGKVILITGGGSGIGPAVAKAFAVSGATKIAILGRTESTLLATKKEIEGGHKGVKVLTFVADITNQAAVQKAFESTKKTFGSIDILVANAGYLPSLAPVATAPVEKYMEGYEVNVKGNLNVYQAFLPVAAPNPTLVYVSTSGIHFPPVPVGLSAYAGSKMAAQRMTDYFAAENPGVRVMSVHPGTPRTAMYDKAKEQGLDIASSDSKYLTKNFKE